MSGAETDSRKSEMLDGLRHLLRSKLALHNMLKHSQYYDERDDYYFADAIALESAVYALQNNQSLNEAQLAQLRVIYQDDFDYYLSGGDKEFGESARLVKSVIELLDNRT